MAQITASTACSSTWTTKLVGGPFDVDHEEPPSFDQAQTRDSCTIARWKPFDMWTVSSKSLFEILSPSNTYVTITADHGELFGENGYFGHGPIQHEKVFEVPFVEGLIR